MFTQTYNILFGATKLASFGTDIKNIKHKKWTIERFFNLFLHFGHSGTPLREATGSGGEIIGDAEWSYSRSFCRHWNINVDGHHCSSACLVCLNNRVTRLGEFSPSYWVTLDIFFKLHK
jgi:hypothetical protein